jgi:hypothetical protein
VLGSALGALVAVRGIGASRIAATLSEMLGTPISADEAWLFFLLSLVLAAFLQATVLILASTAAGAWAKK